MGDIGIKPSTEEYEEKNAIDFIIDTVNEILEVLNQSPTQIIFLI